MLALDLDPGSVMLGINNRDLETFKVDITNNARIMESAPGQQVPHLSRRALCPLIIQCYTICIPHLTYDCILWEGHLDLFNEMVIEILLARCCMRACIYPVNPAALSPAQAPCQGWGGDCYCHCFLKV